MRKLARLPSQDPLDSPARGTAVRSRALAPALALVGSVLSVSALAAPAQDLSAPAPPPRELVVMAGGRHSDLLVGARAAHRGVRRAAPRGPRAALIAGGRGWYTGQAEVHARRRPAAGRRADRHHRGGGVPFSEGALDRPRAVLRGATPLTGTRTRTSAVPLDAAARRARAGCSGCHRRSRRT